MYAIIHMRPLDAKRQPIDEYPIKRVAIIPRDGELHQVAGAWELNKEKEIPYFVQVWADGKGGKVFEMECDPPTNKLRFLDGITCYMLLRVPPRRN